MLRSLSAVLLILMLSAGGIPPITAAESSHPILLRRTTIDPTAAPQSLSATASAEAGALALIQLDHPPTAADLDQLRVAGLVPLLPIPEQALLVRIAGSGPNVLAAAPGITWASTLDPWLKLDPELEQVLSTPDDALLDPEVVTTPDGDPAAVARALAALGGSISEQSTAVTGSILRTSLPARALQTLLGRSDIIWIEPARPMELLDEKARAILGVTPQVTGTWLTGAGQIVAVTDSGLDVQENLSPDFAWRIVRGFSNSEMVASCGFDDWTDRKGHGTHVAGTIFGSGASSNGQYSGIAPQAWIVVQSTSTGGNTLNCLPNPASYLQKAYDAGARIQNASFGSTTGSTNTYGGYTSYEQQVDSFLWLHRDHLFVVAAGNAGADRTGADTNGDGIGDPDGKIDSDSIASPATAKNVLAVGASENNRPPTTPCTTTPSNNRCYSSFAAFKNTPTISADPISNNPAGLAAFSSRGPTDDGRIKPEIVAPGTNVISTRSHFPSASNQEFVNANYAYETGTSMATPAVSGMAALARQWLVNARGTAQPSSALLRAMLLNGTDNIQPGQYGTGSTREIGPAWPDTNAGWGRAQLANTVALDHDGRIWFSDKARLSTGQVATYQLQVTGGQPLRLTLSWTDYPSTPFVGKTLVNNLDLELELPGGTILRGNAQADLPAICRDLSGADTCNTSETIEIATPAAGAYIVRVRGSLVSPLAGTQPFAVVARAQQIDDLSLAAPTLQPIVTGPTAAVGLQWSAVSGADSYHVEISPDGAFGADTKTLAVTQTTATAVQAPGTISYRVRACLPGGCGLPSNIRTATTSAPIYQAYEPVVVR